MVMYKVEHVVLCVYMGTINLAMFLRPTTMDAYLKIKV